MVHVVTKIMHGNMVQQSGKGQEDGMQQYRA